MARRKRSRLSIVMSVLEAIEREGPLPPTRLATYANMPYDRLRRLLGDLEERGIVRVEPSGDGRSFTVDLTSKGRQVLGELRRLRRLLGDLGLAEF